MEYKISSKPPLSKIDKYIIGFSSLLIYIAWDGNFNMQITIPIFFILLLEYIGITKGKIVGRKELTFTAFILLAYNISLGINLIFDNKIISTSSVTRIVYMAEIFAYFFLVTCRRFTLKDVKTILVCNFLSGICIASGILFNYLHGVGYKISITNIWGTIIEENYTASLLAIQLMLAIYFFRYTTKIRKKIVLSIAVGYMGFCLLLTGCRAAFLACCISIAVMGSQYLFSKKVKFITKIIVISIVVILLVIFYVNAEKILPQFLYYRLFTNSYNDTSNIGRIEIWKMGLNGFWERPIFGYGVGNFNYYFSEYFLVGLKSVVVAHNTYLDYLLDVGLLGTSLIGCYLYNGMRDLLKRPIFIPIIINILFTALIVGGERTFFLWNTLSLLTMISQFYHYNKRCSINELFNL